MVADLERAAHGRDSCSKRVRRHGDMPLRRAPGFAIPTAGSSSLGNISVTTRRIPSVLGLASPCLRVSVSPCLRGKNSGSPPKPLIVVWAPWWRAKTPRSPRAPRRAGENNVFCLGDSWRSWRRLARCDHNPWWALTCHQPLWRRAKILLPLALLREYAPGTALFEDLRSPWAPRTAPPPPPRASGPDRG